MIPTPYIIMSIVLICAAILDYKTRAVPNLIWLIAIVLLLPFVTAYTAAVAFIVLLCGYIIYELKWCGAADSKALFVVALSGVDVIAPTLIFATILTGLAYFFDIKKVPYICAMAPAYILSVIYLTFN